MGCAMKRNSNRICRSDLATPPVIRVSELTTGAGVRASAPHSERNGRSAHMRKCFVVSVLLVAATAALGQQRQPGQPGQPGQPPMPPTFAGARISHLDTMRVPMTCTAIRGSFDLQQVPPTAWLLIEVDDQFNAYVNGSLVGAIEKFTDGKARAYPIADLLHQGKNTVAVEAYSALDKMNMGPGCAGRGAQWATPTLQWARLQSSPVSRPSGPVVDSAGV